MKQRLAIFLCLALAACENAPANSDKTDTAGAMDTAISANCFTIDTLTLDHGHNVTNCLNKDCDSFILVKNLNKELQIAIEQCNMDTSFNSALISVMGMSFLVDTLLLQKEIIPSASVNGIYKLTTSQQQFIYFWLPPKHSFGSNGWKMVSVLIQMIDGKPAHAFAYNNYVERDPEGSNNIDALSCSNGKLRIQIRQDASARPATYEIENGKINLIN